ncbi:MAG: GNAT family N-acetyltransferase [Phycisphaerales bacterium]|nr:GNAT family N-acetyltransferase [Phycisphaerales bacterium]
MAQLPTIQTDRLTLRPFTLDDAPVVRLRAGRTEIAATTLNIPHPYEEGMAEQWIGTHQQAFDDGRGLTLAITIRETGTLVGAVGLGVSKPHDRAELGYWIAVEQWGNGYATEASLSLVRYGFETMKMNRIDAHHFTVNPASGRVMQKTGMTCEGTLRQYVRKGDTYHDIAMYAALRCDFTS